MKDYHLLSVTEHVPELDLAEKMKFATLFVLAALTHLSDEGMLKRPQSLNEVI